MREVSVKVDGQLARRVLVQLDREIEEQVKKCAQAGASLEALRAEALELRSQLDGLPWERVSGWDEVASAWT